ncbi:alpha-amylase family glycosyl hydrolase [Spirosoma flavum]|uniref:Alpha-amylase family glycosyl hydrolase n=1 Tax=Spirosoma flavum TaxID=2048557 RepID=A0ABW6AQ01_9BACT
MRTLFCFLIGWLTTTLVAAQTHPNWIKQAVFYQIYPSSFQDSDGNGIGDLKGIQSRLDYIQSLGINTIWLNPIFKSAFQDGGYDVIDFYEVDPRFGSNTGLVDFVNQVHKRGMHVVLDLVAGHSSNQSEWFKQSMQADTNLRYSNYYIWAPHKPTDLTQQEASRWVEANAPRGKYYIKNFYDIQPALNFGYAKPNPNHPWEQPVDAPGPQAVRSELKNVITFWMEKGVDGFRVDLAASLIKNDPDKKATIALWNELNAWFDEKFPNGLLIAEWFNPKQSIAAGFDIDFLKPGHLFSPFERGQKAPAKVYFDKAGEGAIINWYTDFRDQYESTLNKGYISLPTGNHDSPRIADSSRHDPDQLKVAMTFLLTLPGIPFVYYGDEIGMNYIPNSPDVEGSHARSGTRTPMQWDGSQNAGFSAASTNKIYIPQDPDPNRPTVAKQDKDSNSLLNYVRKLLALRASSPALGSEGEWALVSDVNKPYPIIYRRFNGADRYIILINPSGNPVKADVPTMKAKQARYVFGTSEKSNYTIGKGTDAVTVPAVSAAIYKLD